MLKIVIAVSMTLKLAILVSVIAISWLLFTSGIPALFVLAGWALADYLYSVHISKRKGEKQ